MPIPVRVARHLRMGALVPILFLAVACDTGAHAGDDAVGPDPSASRSDLSASAEPSSREAEVIAVAEAFLEALSSKDGAALEALSLPGGSVHAVVVAEDGAVEGISSRPMEDDVVSIPANPNALFERMWDPVARVHGPIGIVWTPYDFWVNGAWSHCGVDAFSMIETEEGWRISSITYTVERAGCPEPPLPPPTPEELGVEG
jgi:hypothetical protein